MTMTPEQVKAAWLEQINTGESPAFERMLDQLWSGDLTLMSTNLGSIIRAATPEERAAHVADFDARGISGVRRGNESS